MCIFITIGLQLIACLLFIKCLYDDSLLFKHNLSKNYIVVETDRKRVLRFRP